MEDVEALDENDIPELRTTTPTSGGGIFENNPHSIDYEIVIPIIRSLNKIQSEVFYKIRNWCLRKINENINYEPFYLFITGGVGTGKFHIIKAIYYEARKILRNHFREAGEINVLLSASTGVAAHNINGNTIHSLLKIPRACSLPYKPLGENNLNSLKAKLGNLQILIIDEISMISHKLMCYIHGRLRQIKHSGDEEQLFGRVSIVAVGDFYQLPPVKGDKLFSPRVIGKLWTDYFEKVELQEIMRQKYDKIFAELLNRIRIKSKNTALGDSDVQVLKTEKPGRIRTVIYIFIELTNMWTSTTINAFWHFHKN